MDTVVQWNIRGFRSNYEELKPLLNRSQSAVVALQECRLDKGRSPPRGYTLLLPQGRPSSYETEHVSQKFSATGLYAAVATISLEKTNRLLSIPASQYPSFETLSG
ncbi:hypothetical protein PoB_001496700 [Plakobranchus ocellatus]|uniref:Endonuclease/exonuclease/phosphatase domain-containing protein n=1 Tax=Plakobranchus ocellatus TaxID=259542 RepID=A0AAV3Z1U1_9GAST|nr:hypothetical protein PoB_001496700 [Plakobranchus ocellatus]